MVAFRSVVLSLLSHSSFVVRRSSFAFSLSFHRCAEAVVIPETPLYFNLASLTLGLQGSHLFMDWCVDD